MMEALTAFDAVAIVLMIVSTLMAMARGFMRELATLGAFTAAITGAVFANRYFAGPIQGFLPDAFPDWSSTAILFVAIFLIIYVFVAWFGASLSKSIQGPDGISMLDRLAGALFGFARGGIVLVFFVYMLNLAMDEDQIPEFVSLARTYPVVLAGADYIKERAPELAARTVPQAPLDDPVPEE